MRPRLPRAELVAALSSFLVEPRVVTAMTTMIIGVGACSFAIRQFIGWAGLIAILSTVLVLVGASFVAGRRYVQWRGLLPISLLVFVFWAGISIFWSQYHWATLAGLAYLLCFFCLALYVALMRETIQIIRAFGDVMRFVLAVSLTLEILAGMLIDAPIKFLGVLGKLDVLGPVQGVMGSRNQLGIMALIALATFGTEFRTHMISRGLSLASIALAGGLLLLSRSPLAIGAFLVVCVAACALYGLRRAEPERRRWFQLGLLVVTAIVIAVAWVFRGSIVTLFNAGGDLTYRLAVWHKAWDLVVIRPLQGWGWIGAWREDIAPFQLFSDIGAREETSASNAYLDVWFQLGLVGFVILVGMLGLTFARSWLLASRRRSVVFAWPALVLVVLIVTALGESSLLGEFGWMTLVLCSLKAAQEMSWRHALDDVS